MLTIIIIIVGLYITIDWIKHPENTTRIVRGMHSKGVTASVNTFNFPFFKQKNQHFLCPFINFH